MPRIAGRVGVLAYPDVAAIGHGAQLQRIGRNLLGGRHAEVCKSRPLPHAAGEELGIDVAHQQLERESGGGCHPSRGQAGGATDIFLRLVLGFSIRSAGAEVLLLGSHILRGVGQLRIGHRRNRFHRRIRCVRPVQVGARRRLADEVGAVNLGHRLVERGVRDTELGRFGREGRACGILADLSSRRNFCATLDGRTGRRLSCDVGHVDSRLQLRYTGKRFSADTDKAPSADHWESGAHLVVYLEQPGFRVAPGVAPGSVVVDELLFFGSLHARRQAGVEIARPLPEFVSNGLQAT